MVGTIRDVSMVLYRSPCVYMIKMKMPHIRIPAFLLLLVVRSVIGEIISHYLDCANNSVRLGLEAAKGMESIPCGNNHTAEVRRGRFQPTPKEVDDVPTTACCVDQKPLPEAFETTLANSMIHKDPSLEAAIFVWNDRERSNNLDLVSIET